MKSEAELARTRSAVASPRRLPDPSPAAPDVEPRQVAATVVAAVEADVALADVLSWDSGAAAELPPR
ncbi:hypothetical protein [Modestobacter sp. SSW1-42]|uniref:hypothetical protein n=1 Tax=Modestobacter sp. SSW1-42 TaxID=596372 RepID=UPI0039865CEA